MSKLPSLFSLKLTKTNPLGLESVDMLGREKNPKPEKPHNTLPVPSSAVSWRCCCVSLCEGIFSRRLFHILVYKTEYWDSILKGRVQIILAHCHRSLRFHQQLAIDPRPPTASAWQP